MRPGTRQVPRVAPVGKYAPRRSRWYWFDRQGTGTDVLTAARERVRYVYATFDHVLVSFSGGKDSTAVLNVACEVAAELDAAPVRCVFFDEEAISLQTEAYVRRTAARADVELEWYCLPVRHRNACAKTSPVWWPWAPEAEDLWVRPLPPEALRELAGFPAEPPRSRPSIPQAAPLLAPYAEHGRTAILMGIRAAESLTRLKAVSRPRVDNWIVPFPATPAVWKAYPVFDWTTADVWTAPAEQGWDYNASYDALEMAGVPHHLQRCAPPFGEEPMQDLWIWQVCFPELWDRMCARVPGAAAAARYARTELYSFAALSAKPAGLSWEDYVLSRIEAHPPEAREAVRENIRKLITRHYSRTADPILPHARHPDTGMSWAWLVAVAERGDFKERRAASAALNGPAYARAARRYTEELEAWRAEHP